MAYATAITFLTGLLICSVVVRGFAWNYKTQNAITLVPVSQNRQEFYRMKCNDDTTYTKFGKFTWKYSNDEIPYAVSDNICWNSTINDIVIRKCDTATGKWFPSSVNCALPKRINLKCPEDLTEIQLRGQDKIICVKISHDSQQFSRQFCYGSDTLAVLHPEHLTNPEMNALIEFLGVKNIRKFWLPVQRQMREQYSLFTVQLPGSYWNEVFEVELSKENFLSDKNCLAAVVNGSSALSIEMTHCSEFLHSVCVFKDNLITVSGCPQGFGAMSYRPNDCYGIEWEYGLFPYDLRPLSIAEYFSNRNSLQMILKVKEPLRSRYFAMEYLQDPSGIYAVEMNVKEDFRIVKMQENERKPALSNEIVNNRKNVEMTLKMDMEEEELILLVYNRNYIWRVDDEDNFGIKCFTNAGHNLWDSVHFKKIWENDFETKTMFKLKLDETVAGYYWCVAHTIFNFTFVTTPKVVAVRRQKGHSFAMFFDLRCSGIECLYPHKHVKNFNKRLKNRLSNLKKDHKAIFENLVIHNVRVMEIEVNSSSDSFNQIKCLCHVAVSLKTSSVDNSSEKSSEEADSEESILGIRHDTSIRMQEGVLLANLISLIYPDYGSNVKSTEYCFPESFQMANGVQNQWNLAQHGQSATSIVLCLQKNGLPITRKCEGNFLRGAHWEEILDGEISCAIDFSKKIITQNLYELDLSKASKSTPEKVVKDIKNLLESNMNNLIPADLYYMALIIQGTIKTIFSPGSISVGIPGLPPLKTTYSTNTEYITTDIVRIYNYLLQVNESIIRPSIILNSTNILLDAFENLIDKISLTTKIQGFKKDILSTTADGAKTLLPKTIKLGAIIEENDKLIDTIEYEDVGVVVKIASNFVVFIINPNVANITGIGIFNMQRESEEEFEDLGLLRGAFENDFYRFILANQSANELLYEENLQAATYVPDTLWHRLDEISRFSNSTAHGRPEAKVVIKVYSNDKLFQENETYPDRAVGGKVISISIPGHDKELPEMLPIFFKASRRSKSNETESSCSYWNYKSWANDGLVFLGRSSIDEDLVLCGCTHLTPFAYLIGGSYNHSYSIDEDVIIVIKTHEAALDVITFLGCSLSLFGIIGIFATAATFQSWRKKASSKVLLQLSAAIALQMILFCFINTEQYSHHLIENKIFSSCIAIGALLHYSVLVQFFWMLIIAYLQFKRYVQIFGKARPKHFFIKSFIFGWGVPVIPVTCVLLLDPESYIPTDRSVETSICYPSGRSLYIGIVLPILIIISANLIIFVVVITSIFKGAAGVMRHTEKRLAVSQMRLSILLFFLLGFTWIFGLMTTMRMGLIFSYLFSLTATLQGFVLFIYFIILDPITRRMWYGYFQRIFGLKNNYDSSTSMRETTQTS